MLARLSACLLAFLSVAYGHDNFASAEVIANNSTTSVSNASATNEAGEPSDIGYRTQWYRYVAPARGIVRINTTHPNTPTGLKHRVRAYRGDSLDKLNFVDGVASTSSFSDLTLTFPAEAGMEFRIVVATLLNGNSGTIPFTIQQDAWPYGGTTSPLIIPDVPGSGLPPNDDISASKVITSSASAVSVLDYNFSASQSGIGPEPDLTGYRTLWYRWIAPKRGIAVINTPASPVIGFAHIVSIFRGNDISAITSVLDDAADSNGQALVRFPVEAGMEYRICFGSTYDDEGGPLLFSIRTDPWLYGTGAVVKPLMPTASVPANDQFESARSIPSKLGKFTILDYNASATTASSSIEPLIGYKSLWYDWQAPEDTYVSLQTPSTNGVGYPHAVFVLTGADYETLTELPDDVGYFAQDTSGRCGFLAKKGKTYHISFTTQSPNAFGAVILNMEAGPKVNPSGPQAKFVFPKENAKVPKSGFDIVPAEVGSDPQGIKLVELKVNGKVVHRKIPKLSNTIFSKRVKTGKVKLELRFMDWYGRWGKTEVRYVTAG